MGLYKKKLMLSSCQVSHFSRNHLESCLWNLSLSSAKHHGINLSEIAAYIDAFKYGCPPHAGGMFSFFAVFQFLTFRWNRYGARNNVVPRSTQYSHGLAIPTRSKTSDALELLLHSFYPVLKTVVNLLRC